MKSQWWFDMAGVALMSGLLTACGGGSSPADAAGGGGGGVAVPPPVTADGQGKPCQSGPGRTYNVTIPSPLGGDETIAATVFEPTQMDCGLKYPLVLWGSGFGSPRDQGGVPSDPQNIAFNAFAPTAVLQAAGYGVLSFDHRGHGQSGGKIRVQDPDYEGANVVRVVDWAEANLDWLAYGPRADGLDPHNLKLGAVGPSYGGLYQLMLLAIDPKQRLDAIAPAVTGYDLNNSLLPGGVLKDAWVHALADGKEDQFDPFVNQQLALMRAENGSNPLINDALTYHSLRYFCAGEPVATNGGPGTAPLHAPAYPPMVNALIFQSSRDTLFTHNEGVANYECLKLGGGDVRLFTEQAGHNTLGVAGTLGVSSVPQDPGVIYQPDPSSTGISCGGVQTIEAVVAFFNEHLKDIAGSAAQVLGTQPICLSLTSLDSVRVDQNQRGGPEFVIAAGAAGNTVTLGQDDSQATTVPLLTVAAVSQVLGGIPTMDVTLTDPDHPTSTGGANNILFIGIGHKRAGGLTPWDLVDNQLTPLRGLGRHTVDLAGVLERALQGDQIGLMIFGANANQYATTGTQADRPHATRVKVAGKVQLPLLGNLLPVPLP
jgi:ABC-2 type transport system ATP-binding protein